MHLPIRRAVFYKHGVGFFVREGDFTGESLELTFRRAQLDDVLKSLTIVDHAGGRVLDVAYPTPLTRQERLAASTIQQLDDNRSLRDLLTTLRGRHLRLSLSDETTLRGMLLGLDEPDDDRELAQSLLSLLEDESHQLRIVRLADVSGVEVLDARAREDLRFFLETSRDDVDRQPLTVRLTSGEHHLSVSYLAPAPMWRVSYRFMLEPRREESSGKLLLQGWGIFENMLNEDLKAVTLTLIAGRPLSFDYDLASPLIPRRPKPKPEVAMRSAGAVPPSPKRRAAPALMATAAETASPRALGSALGELFQYQIKEPVTVARGQSALVPILSATVEYQKQLLYDGNRESRHPMATLRLRNESGLALERGPVTVLESGTYVGEGVLSFTPQGAEITLPYAVEMGVHIEESEESETALRGLGVAGAYLILEEWHLRRRRYRINNKTEDPSTVLIDHPRQEGYEHFDTPEPEEITGGTLRFAVKVAANTQRTLVVQERRLVRRREALQKQSMRNLQRYLQHGLLDRETSDRLAKLLMLWDTVADYKEKLAKLDAEEAELSATQADVRENIEVLSPGGEEGLLRSKFVRRLENLEEQRDALRARAAEIEAELERVEGEISQRLEALGTT